MREGNNGLGDMGLGAAIMRNLVRGVPPFQVVVGSKPCPPNTGVASGLPWDLRTARREMRK